MTRRSYVNTVQEAEIGIAIERLLVADFPTSFTPARVDLDALPAGFVDLGSVVEDTPSFKVTRTKFQLQAGIPMALQYTAIMGIEGQFSIALNSNSWRKCQYAFGNYTQVTSAVFVGTVNSLDTGASFFTSSTSVQTCYQYVTAAATTGFDSAGATEIRVTGVTTTGATSGFYRILHTTPGKPLAVGDKIGFYSVVSQPIGGRAIRYYTLLGVADFVDGVQVVHEIFKASSAADWTEEIRPNQSARIPLTFDALGVDTVIGSCTEQTIGKRHYFPANVCC